MTIDIAKLSAKELATLINKAKKRKTQLNKRKPLATVRKKVAALAKAEGFTIAELFGAGGRAAKGTATRAPRKARKAGGKVAPKYRNPANPSETWTGRGKHPRWLAAEMAKGRKAEDFLIK